MTSREDVQFDTMLSYVLRGGVLLSAAIVAVGAAIFLARHGFEQPAYREFLGEPDQLRSIAGILGATRQGSGRGIVQLGLLLLIATPIARVVFSVFGFLRQRDWLYVGITLVVLALLGYSLLAGS